jgi:hypothetical protein
MPQIVVSTLIVGLGLASLVAELIQNEMLPQWTYPITFNFVVWALLASGVLAWFHGAKGAQETTATEKTILAVLALGWVASTILIALP